MNNQEDKLKAIFGKTQKELQHSFIYPIERYCVSVGQRLDSGHIVPIQAAFEMKAFVNGYIFALQNMAISLGFEFVNIEEFQIKLEESVDLIYPNYQNSLSEIGNTISTSDALEGFKKLLKTCRNTKVNIEGINEYSASLSNSDNSIIVLK